jgi:hypothetical protein
MEKDLADLDASLAASTSTGQYGLTAVETALGMQALQKVKESLGDLSVSNIGNVLAIGLAQTKALAGNPALLRPPGLDPSRPASTESTAPRESPSEDCMLTSRPPHELLLVTIIQYLVV